MQTRAELLQHSACDPQNDGSNTGSRMLRQGTDVSTRQLRRPPSRLRSRLVAGLEALHARPRFCLAVCTLLLLVQIRPWWNPQPDARSYLSMARSLADGGRMLNLGNPHLWYFPGYSLLLSPVFFAGERPLWLLSTFQWACAIVLLVGVYQWAKRVLPDFALPISALSVLNAQVWELCAHNMSEVPFMCGFVWSANAAFAAERSTTRRATALRTFVAAILLILTVLIRPAGIMLAAGFGLHLGWRVLQRRESWTRAIALTLVFGIPASAAILDVIRSERTNAVEHGGRTYLSNFSDSATHPLASYIEGVRLAIRDSGRVVVPGMFKAYQTNGWLDMNLPIYVAVGLLLSVGWWRLTRETADSLLLAVPFYVVLHIAYPLDAGARFFVPLAPVFMASICRLVCSLPKYRLVLANSLLVAHFLVALGYHLTIEGPRAQLATQRWAEIDQIASQIDDARDRVAAWNVDGNDVLMFEVDLDRPVPLSQLPPESPGIEWVIATSNSPDIAQFRECAETATMRLLRRDVPPSSARPLRVEPVAN